MAFYGVFDLTLFKDYLAFSLSYRSKIKYKLLNKLCPFKIDRFLMLDILWKFHRHKHIVVYLILMFNLVTLLNNWSLNIDWYTLGMLCWTSVWLSIFNLAISRVSLYVCVCFWTWKIARRLFFPPVLVFYRKHDLYFADIFFVLEKN